VDSGELQLGALSANWRFGTRRSAVTVPALVVLAEVAALVLATAGCASVDPGVAMPPLRGTLWVLVPANVPEMSPLPRPPALQLAAASDQLGGFTGCNRLLGRYRLDGSTLAFGDLGSTRMACAVGAADEQRFLETLPRVQRWQMQGRELQLLDAAGTPLLRLRAEIASP
jgi:heat shock protein HslJ